MTMVADKTVISVN